MSSFADLVRVRNKHTGQIGRVSRAVFNNPRLNPGILVEVDDLAKPYLRGFYTSKYNLPEVNEDITTGGFTPEPLIEITEDED